MLTVTPLPAFSDNYIWAIQHGTDPGCYVVDPGDAAVVMAYLRAQQRVLSGILITHHHADHTDGVQRLLHHWQVPVYGPNNSPTRWLTHRLKDGHTIKLLDYAWHIIATPGHTLDHIAYFTALDTAQQPALFCGDTLFAGGCGRLFEGTPRQMQASLDKLVALPTTTDVYCAHEYTLANLQFAALVEPDNTAIQQRIAQATHLRQQGKPTVPSSIGLEKQTNPFLRTRELAVIAAAKRRQHSASYQPEQVLGIIRAWKDHY